MRRAERFDWARTLRDCTRSGKPEEEIVIDLEANLREFEDAVLDKSQKGLVKFDCKEMRDKVYAAAYGATFARVYDQLHVDGLTEQARHDTAHEYATKAALAAAKGPLI